MKKTLVVMVLAGFLLTAGCQEDQQSQNNSTQRLNNFNIASLHENANTILHRSLSSDNSAIKANAIEVVAETGRKDLMPTVVRLLKDESVAVKFTAAMAVGDMNYKAGALSVKPLLKDADLNAKMAAAYALTKMGKESLESILSRGLNSKNQTIRANAALLLGKLGKKDALNPLKWVLNDEDSNDNVKIQAIEAMAMLGIDKKMVYGRLWTLLVSKYADDKIIGIRGMRLLNTSESRAAMGTMLIDEMPEIRLYAAEQLARISDFNGKNEVINYFEVIRPQLDSPSKKQSDRLATMAIGRIGGPELEKHLPMLMKSRHKDIQLRAAQAVLLLGK